MADSPRRAPVADLVRAAHQARTRGERRLAARLFLDAEHPYEAAVCLYEVHDKPASLKSFLAVPPADRRYRRACVQAVRVACELGQLTYELEQFLTPFLATGPSNDEEMAAVYELAVAHEAAEMGEVASDLFGTLVRVVPGYRDAAKRLSDLEAAGQAGNHDAGLEEHLSFWRPLSSSHADGANAATESSAEIHVSVAGFTDSGPRSAGDEREKPSMFDMPRSVQVPSGPPPPASGSASTPPKSDVHSADSDSGAKSAPGRSVLEKGALVADRYRIEEELGRGGMGVVYRALDVELNHPVAIKLLSIASGQGDMLQRFKQELTLCRQISHVNVIRLYDIGAHESYKFISMELLSGESLRRQIRAGIKLKAAIDYLKQICAGIDAIHGLGIVHRDIKPDNIFVGKNGVLKLMDFGLAKSVRASTPANLTSSGFLAGTPGFMAPEQFTSFGSVTEQADLYSLGVLTYLLLTGVRPFVHGEHQALLELQLTTVPDPPSKHQPSVPPSLDAVILAMLHRHPGKRPSASTLATAIAKASP